MSTPNWHRSAQAPGCPMCWWNRKLAKFLRAWAHWIARRNTGEP